MVRPTAWKVVTVGVTLSGLSVAGAGAAQADTRSPNSGTASVSAAPLFNEPRLFGSGSGQGDFDGDFNVFPRFPLVGGCVAVTGPFGNVSGSVCI